jgi:antitoxin ParD1/3/4
MEVRPMNVTLSSRSEDLLKQIVDSGRYESADAALEDALLVLDEQIQHERLRAAVAIGDEEIERGEIVPYTPALFEEIKRNAARMAREGRSPDPDVCP